MANPNLSEYGKNTRFSKTNQPKNAGRKPSRLKRFIKDNNLSSLDIALMIKQVFEKNEVQLNEILADEKKPMLIRLFVKVFLQDFLKGNLHNWEALMRRTFGDPQKFVNFTMDNNDMTDEELDDKINSLIEKRNNKDV